MADGIITKQELIDAKVDAQTLEDIVNDGPEIQVQTRLGRLVWTLATLEQRSLLKIQEWQNAIDSIVVENGVPAMVVVDSSGVTQQEINDLGGVRYWTEKAGGYQLNNEVRLADGDVVKSTVPNNIIDPNADMTGWTFPPYKASQIFDKSGLTQQKINDLTLTPFHFGAVGDGSSHKLSERYATLIAAQAAYPHATSLDDEIDWCALYAFLDFCEYNFVQNANWSINAFTNKELFYGTKTASNPATKSISGLLQLTTSSQLKHQIQIVGNSLDMGSIIGVGYQPDFMVSRTVKHGIVLGAYNNESYTCQNSNFQSLMGERTIGLGVVMGRNAHFTNVAYVRGASCGSLGDYGDVNTHSANFSNRVDTWGDIGQNTKITVDSMPPDMSDVAERIYILINNEIYQVIATDTINSTISVYPCIDTTISGGVLNYNYGGSYTVISNNTAQTVVNNCESILCARGYDARALYGTRFLAFTTEYCGIGALIGERGEAHIGSSADGGYFEANVYDIVTGWGLDSFKSFTSKNNVGLDLSKIRSMFAYRLKTTNKLRSDWLFTTCLDVDVARKNYSGEYSASGLDVTDPLTTKVFWTNSIALTLSADENTYNLFLKGGTIYEFAGSGSNGNPTGLITLNAASGYTINGSASYVIDGSKYDSPIIVTVIRSNTGTLVAKINATLKNPTSKGTTAQRPASPILGQRYYDTTLLAAGKPIEWNGVNWVDSNGTTV